MNSKLNGKIINLVTNDGARLESIVFFLPYILIAPIQAIIVVYILILKIDKSFLSGLFLLSLLIPVQTVFAKVYSHFRYTFNFKLFLEYVFKKARI